MPRKKFALPRHEERPNRNTLIYLGDLARALEALQADDPALRREIAHILGFQVVEETPVIKAPPSTPPPITVSPPPAGAGGETIGDLQPTTPPTIPPTWKQDGVPSTLEMAELASGRAQENVVVLPRTAGDSDVTPLPLQPLFVPNWTRAILSGALATNGNDGPLDMDRLVELLARRAPFAQLPRRPAPTLRRGVQLLLDKSESMRPFSRDQSDLQARIVDVVGGDRVQSLRFVGCPSRGAGTGPITNWEERYTPPPAGTVVLILSDLGIGPPHNSPERAPVAEWEAFAAELEYAMCPLVAFVPYASGWPPALARCMTIIHWDRPTTALNVRNRVGAAHEVSR